VIDLRTYYLSVGHDLWNSRI